MSIRLRRGTIEDAVVVGYQMTWYQGHEERHSGSITS
jgi:hypothetical protein